MKIGLLDVDSHHFPNLALMKISAAQKKLGNSVERWDPDNNYDTVYASKVFTESTKPEVDNADTVIWGGSGIDLVNKLPDGVEHQTPDYSLYPEYDFALGFLTRGCPCKDHAFCITPEKDGNKSIMTADLQEFWTGQKQIKLLDQNLLACKEHRLELIQQLRDSKSEIEFVGGSDIRFMSDEIIDAFRGVKVKDFHFAWDSPRENLTPMFEKVVDSGVKSPGSIGVYILVNYWSTIEEDLKRIYSLRSLGLMPYVMIYDKQKYVNARGRWLHDVEKRFTLDQLRNFKTCQHMQRWANMRSIIKSCPKFEDYEPYRKWKERVDTKGGF